MKYIADILTLSRISIGLGLIAWFGVAYAQGLPEKYFVFSLVLASIALITDVLDGSFARRYPYSDADNAKLFWRKDPHAFDNAGDLLLYIAVGLTLSHSSSVWFWVIAGFAAAGAGIFLSVEALLKRGSPWAEKLDVAFGWMFGMTLVFMLIALAEVSLGMFGMWLYVALAGVVAALVLPFKWNRMTTRPERRV